jgi:hypothetical protein
VSAPASSDLVLWSADAATLDGWSAYADAGARAALARDPGPSGALRFDFTLPGTRSWAIARRTIDVALPRTGS